MEFEIWNTARCALNVAKTLNPGSPAANKLCEWLGDDGVEIGINLSNVEKEKKPKQLRNPFGASSVVPITKKQWSQGLKALASFVEKGPSEEKSPIEDNLILVAKELGLDGLEEKILGAFVRHSQFDMFEHLCDRLIEARTLDVDNILARVFGVKTGEVQTRLRRESALFRLGLLSPPTRLARELPGRAEPPPAVIRTFMLPNNSVSDFCQSLIGESRQTELDWDDFAYLKDTRDFALEIVRGALKRRERGINILLYGPPGTGKTEFAKSAARAAGVDIYSIGEVTEEGEAPTTNERLASYRLANALLATRGTALLLFDEMEDLLEHNQNMFGGRVAAASKVFLNRLIEGNPVPTFWTTNSIESFDPALRRRMTFAVEMTVPPRKIREKVWCRVLEKEKVSLPPEEIARLANDFPEAPSLASSAVRAAKLAGGEPERVRLAIRSVAGMVRGHRLKEEKPMKEGLYDLSLLNADTDLEALAVKVCSLKEARRVSFCLSGPPGTGKSAYIRHLARRLGIEVLHKRASDLMSMWVGGTEKNIAAAFRQARDEEAFLVFDEADSFLQDRSLALRSWEVTGVNEMLTWMEHHEYPFACTTNFTDRLDPASLRRFTFKVAFDYLSPLQNEAAFRLYFRLDPPILLQQTGHLTPGDFAVVLRKAEILGCVGDSGQLTRMLREESQAKGERRPTGFAA